MRISLELVVIVIVLLIVAIVVLGVFTGGIQNFMNIFGATSDQQLKTNLCATACANYCFLHPEATSPPWGSSGVPLPEYKGKPIDNCLALYGGSCNCTK
jgi:hypothetical protein